MTNSWIKNRNDVFQISHMLNGGSSIMKTKYLVKTFCMILAILLISSLAVACSSDNDKDGCDSFKTTELEDKINAINNHIDKSVCCGGNLLTREQLAVCLNNYEYIQVNYSNKLMCEEDGVRYYYPDYSIEGNYKDYKATENTRYKITIRYYDAFGIYSGIKVTAFEIDPQEPTELDLIVEEMNKKILSFECSGLTKEEIDKKVAEFEIFAKEYRKKVYYVDEYEKEHHYPILYCAYHLNENKELEATPITDSTRYCITHNYCATNEDGMITGLEVRQCETAPNKLDLGLL